MTKWIFLMICSFCILILTGCQRESAETENMGGATGPNKQTFPSY